MSSSSRRGALFPLLSKGTNPSSLPQKLLSFHLPIRGIWLQHDLLRNTLISHQETSAAQVWPRGQSKWVSHSQSTALQRIQKRLLHLPRQKALLRLVWDWSSRDGTHSGKHIRWHNTSQWEVDKGHTAILFLILVLRGMTSKSEARRRSDLREKYIWGCRESKTENHKLEQWEESLMNDQDQDFVQK